MLTKFKLGMVAGIVFSLFILGLPGFGADFSKSEGNRLILEYENRSGWNTMPILCKKGIKVNKVPTKMGIWVKRGEGDIKPYMFLKDSEGELFYFLYRMTVSDFPAPGLHVENKITELAPVPQISVAHAVQHLSHFKSGEPKAELGNSILDEVGAKLGNGKVDPPVEFAGLLIIERKPTGKVVRYEFDNITLDGVLVEDFSDPSREWFIPKGWEKKCKWIFPTFKISVTGGIAMRESKPTAGGMELSYSNWHGWGGIPVFCKPIKVSEGVPSTAAVRLKPISAASLNGKVYLMLKDGEGEILWFAAAMMLNQGLITGPVTKELGPIVNTSIDLFTGSIANKTPTPGRKTISELLGGKPGNGKLDGPVSLVGLTIVMRKGSKNTRLQVLEIQFDRKPVEAFVDNRNGWYLPEWKEHRGDYKKLGSDFKSVVAGQSLTSSSSPSASSSKEGDYAKPSGATLEVTVSQPQTWTPLVVGPGKPIQYPGIPQKVGLYSGGDILKAVKPFIILRDAQGVDYEFLFSIVLSSGYREVGVPGAEAKPGAKKPIDLSGAKPPFTFYGLALYCRKPLPESTFYFDNITIDGKLIEGFDKDNAWKVKVKPEQTKCVVRLVKERAGPAVLPETFPERRENLIVNSSMEEWIGSWEYAKAEYIPKDIEGKPIVSMSEHRGKYKWEHEGVESFHSISLEVDTPGKWAGIFTTLKDIKPNTTYVLTFAHRMSQPSGFFLSVFGKRIPIQKIFKENPEHWMRFTEAFNSGSCQGDIPLGFYVKAQDKPIKIWIDEVELYEGFSPIGYDLARLHLLYYNHTYISPDVALPTRFQMETLFSDEKVPKEFSYVFELPEEVTWEGFWCRWSFWSGLEKAMSEGKLSQESIEIDGQKYIRYCFTLPLKKGSKFQEYFVPVGRREHWHGYSGCKTFTAFLGTKKKRGEFYGYYYARWPGGEQPKRKFLLKGVRVDRIKPFRRFQANISIEKGDVEYNPFFAQDMLSIGITGFTCKRRDAVDIVPTARKAGIERFSCWTLMSVLNVRAKGEEALGIGPDGKRISKPSRNIGNCLSYRGKYWQEGINALKSDIDQGYTDFLLDDAEVCICYCEKCRDRFRDFLSKHADLPYKDPRSFVRSGDPVYTAIWKEFSLWHYGMTAKALRDELRTYANEKYPGRHFMLALSSCPVSLSSIIYAFAPESLKGGLDYYTGQWYINWGGFEGSPIIMADRIVAEYKAMGEYALPIIPNFGPGLDYCNPFNSLDPHAVMKYQMLETAFAIPMAGYHMYAADDIDAGDLKHMAEFNKLVSEYEDMIIDGKPVSGVSCTGTSRSSARLKELNGKYLLLVSDYSTYEETPTTVKVTLPFTPKAKLKDVETGRTVLRLRGNKKTFEITLGKSRARVFSFEPI